MIESLRFCMILKRVSYLNDYKFYVFYTEIEKPSDYCLEFVDNRIT